MKRDHTTKPQAKDFSRSSDSNRATKADGRGVIRKTISNRNAQSAKMATVSRAVQTTLIALEPRMLFDGAALATADAVDRSFVEQYQNQESERTLEEGADCASCETVETHLLVVDQSVDGWQQLVANRAPNTELLILDPNADGLAQIAAALANTSNLASIQIVSHGADGSMQLGNRVINESALNASAGVLSEIGGALAKDGDILLFGCDIASSAGGVSFLQALARSTQADVAASSDTTGSAALGGDWVLESTVGQVDSASVLATEATLAYAGTLDSLIVGSGAGTISGRLWDDTLNPNGVLNAGENNLLDFTVTLRYAGVDNTFGTGDDVTYANVTGNSAARPGSFDGEYEFLYLADGNYRLEVAQTANGGPLSGNVKVAGDAANPTGPLGADGVLELTLAGGLPVIGQDFRYVQINNAPTIAAPAAQVQITEDLPYALTGSELILFAEPNDPSASVALSTNYLATLSVTSGVFDVTAVGGAVVTGLGSPSMTIRGSLADVNNTIASLTYQGNLNFVGTDTLQIRLDDNGSFGDADGDCIPNEAVDDNLFATRTVDLCINAVNDGPMAVNDANQTTSTATIPITGNVIGGPGQSAGDRPDTDPESNIPLEICGVAAGVPAGTPTGNVGTQIPGTYGDLTLNADGTYSYLVDPVKLANEGFTPSSAPVTDIFTYCVEDSLGANSKAQLVITIVGNTVPVGNPDVNNTQEDATTPATGNVLGGAGISLGDQADIDPESDPLTVCGLAAGTQSSIPSTAMPQVVTTTYGTLTMNANGTYSYQINNSATAVQQLDAGETVNDVFTYCVTDGKGGADYTTLTIVITGVNDVPVAVPDTNTIQAGTPTVGGNVLPNDSDPDGDPLNICGYVAGNVTTGFIVDNTGAAVEGDYGSITISPTGQYVYTLDQADPRVTGLADGMVLLDTFTYCVEDPNGGQTRTTITITITNPNDPPVALPDSNTTTADSTTPTTGNVLGGPGRSANDQTDTDPQNDPLTVCGVEAGTVSTVPSSNVGTPVPGTYGVISISSNGQYSYQVNSANSEVIELKPGETLTDVFTYCVTDGRGASTTSTVTITITGVNDCPMPASDSNAVSSAVTGVGSNATTTTTSGNALGGVGVSSGDRADTDPDGDTLTVVGVAGGSPAGTPTSGVGQPIEGTYGTLTIGSDGRYTYTVNPSNPTVAALLPGQTITDTFTYAVSDQVCDPQKAQIVININGVDRPPEATGTPRTVTEGGDIACDLALVSDRETGLANLQVRIDSITNGASGVFFVRDPDPTRPGQFIERIVAPGTVLTGEEIARLCFRATPEVGAPRDSAGQLLPPTLNFTVTDAAGNRASASTTVNVLAPPVVPPPAVEPPVVVPPVVPPTASIDPGPPPIVPIDISIPTTKLDPVNVTPPLDMVSLFDPGLRPVDVPPVDKAVRSAAAEEKPKDDCIPEKPKVKAKPKAVKRSIFTDFVKKPAPAFSEQVKEAKKRFKLPAKVAPKVQPTGKEC